ncbi:LysE family translocator [Salinarimonas sp. NSM]|uniref:LysE family translocator n=1 Tax=Salinarimonas sp. NSM TaxID=3458003 RepID=UPI0040363990
MGTGLGLEYLSLILFTVSTCITPGPNNTMLLASGVNYGVRSSMPLLVGINIGFPLMVVAVGLGIGGIFQTWPVLHDVLRIVGSAYLLWLAWRIATAGRSKDAGANARPLTFMQAALFQLVNPKAWIMAVGAVSVYSIASDTYAMQVFAIALIFFLFGTPCSAVWLLGGSAMRRVLGDPRWLRAFNVAMAALLVASLWPVLSIYLTP